MIGFGGVLREFGGVLGSLGGSRGGCLTPIGNLLPLQRFGFKHHIMVQLAYVNRVGITDPFSDLWSPPWGSQRAII